jgi:hypothetical protein
MSALQWALMVLAELAALDHLLDPRREQQVHPAWRGRAAAPPLPGARPSAFPPDALSAAFSLASWLEYFEASRRLAVMAKEQGPEDAAERDRLRGLWRDELMGAGVRPPSKLGLAYFLRAVALGWDSDADGDPRDYKDQLADVDARPGRKLDALVEYWAEFEPRERARRRLQLQRAHFEDVLASGQRRRKLSAAGK